MSIALGAPAKKGRNVLSRHFLKDICQRSDESAQPRAEKNAVGNRWLTAGVPVTMQWQIALAA